MAPEGGLEGAAVKLAAVEAALREDPNSFEFFQAVRLLERLRPDRAGVGRFVDPADEVVRFAVHPSIAFPPSAIEALELPAEGAARMSINFMGLTGPLGVLPHHYTLLISERQRSRDGALGAFFDLFHHRILSLLYRVWEKYRFPVAAEKGEEDRLRAHVLDLVGVGLEGYQRRLGIPDDTLAFYAGLFGLQQRGAVALEQLIEDFFGVPAEVEQFVGGWFPLPDSDQCAVGDDNGASTQLGLGAVAGDEVWDQQSRVRIRLGPLTREQFEQYLPDGRAHERLRTLTRFFSHGQFEFEVQLVLAHDHVPGFVIGADDDAPQPLGWSTWIQSADFARDADETILRL